MEKKIIGKRIQELRKNRRLSQEQVAEKADISPNYLSRIECGKENPTLDMLIKLAHAFTKSADPEKLRLALKIIRAVSR